MNSNTQNTTAYLRALSPRDFQAFGAGYIGYVRPILLNNEQAFALYGADGKLLTLQETPNLALDLARQSGIEPMTIQ